MNAKHAVIAAGGGGIPVVWEDKYHLKGVPAVIDKDFASECMAEQLDADMLIILTAVEKVAINFGKPDQKGLDDPHPGRSARVHRPEGQFAPGSMLPKVEAAVKFAESKPGRTALITLLGKSQGRHCRQDRYYHLSLIKKPPPQSHLVPRGIFCADVLPVQKIGVAIFTAL